jgi:hypothetical protein
MSPLVPKRLDSSYYTRSGGLASQSKGSHPMKKTYAHDFFSYACVFVRFCMILLKLGDETCSGLWQRMGDITRQHPGYDIAQMMRGDRSGAAMQRHARDGGIGGGHALRQ